MSRTTEIGTVYQGLVEFKGIPEQGKLFSLTKENYLAQ